MVSVERFRELLDACLARMPRPLFDGLNGGVLLLPEAKEHRKAKNHDLFVLGEYRHNRQTGRGIVLFYGSFCRAYPHLTEDALAARIEKTVRHEFLHHWESLSGERALEIEDARRIQAYLETDGANKPDRDGRLYL